MIVTLLDLGLEEDLRKATREQQEEFMATILIESDDGKLPSASAVLQVRATNAEYNQPALRIDQASARRRRFDQDR